MFKCEACGKPVMENHHAGLCFSCWHIDKSISKMDLKTASFFLKSLLEQQRLMLKGGDVE